LAIRGFEGKINGGDLGESLRSVTGAAEKSTCRGKKRMFRSVPTKTMAKTKSLPEVSEKETHSAVY